MIEKPSTIILQRAVHSPFSPVPKELLNDSRISWKAKGIISYLLGKPQGWAVQVTDLCNKSSDGEVSVRAGLKELRDFHYVRLEKQRKGGRIVGWIWRVSDTPNLEPEEGCVDSPDLGNPEVVNQDLSKNERNKTDSYQERTSANPSDIAVSSSELIPKTESRHHGFIKLWTTEYEAFHQTKYAFVPGRDVKAVKELVANAGASVQSMVALAKRGWVSHDHYVRSNSLCIFSFAWVINRIAVEDKPAFNNHNI